MRLIRRDYFAGSLLSGSAPCFCPVQQLAGVFQRRF
jgi:hypothetical protein